jgi:hypothetical protein
VRDIYTDLDIQRSTFDYRELWYCRIELDGATLRVSSTLLLARPDRGRAGCSCGASPERRAPKCPGRSSLALRSRPSC